jgi:hypothetical protein
MEERAKNGWCPPKPDPTPEELYQKRREYLLKMRERGWEGRKAGLTTFRHKPRLAVRPPYLTKANDEGGYDIVKRYWKGGKVVEEMHMKHAVRKRRKRI